MGRYLRPFEKSFLKVTRIELFPDPKGPVRAMFLMPNSFAEDNTLFNSSTDW